jgi:hypothetical protein
MARLPRIDADFIEHSIEVCPRLGRFFFPSLIAENGLMMLMAEDCETTLK